MNEGILNNEDSSEQSLLFIRKLECIDEQVKTQKSAFYNTKESEDEALEKLKEETKDSLPKDNVFELTVIILLLFKQFSDNLFFSAQI
jgi:hypothetical protein